jgi:hypothetical protein
MILLVPCALAEGFPLTTQPDVLLLKETALTIDVQSTSNEQILFKGDGSADFYDPNGNYYTTLSGVGMSFIANQTGRWSVQLSEDQTVGWELGVVDNSNFDDINGRLASEEWRIYANTDAPFDGGFYARVDIDNPKKSGDSVLYKLDIHGISGDRISILANAYGGEDYPSWSIPDDLTAPKPDYPLYLNPPEGEYIDSLILTNTDGSISFGNEQCKSVIPGYLDVTFSLKLATDGIFVVGCNLNGDKELNVSGAEDLFLYNLGSAGPNSVSWGGYDALGTPVSPGTYSCAVGGFVAPINMLIGHASTAWPGVRFFHVDSSYSLSSMEMYWNDFLLLEALGDEDGVEMPNGQLSDAYTTGPDGISSGSPLTGLVPDENAHGWGNYSDTSRGDMGWVNTWGFISGGEAGTFQVTVLSGTVDDDVDSLPEGVETCMLGTDPEQKDTDNDQLDDGMEVGDVYNPTDTDSDGTIDALDDDDDGDDVGTAKEITDTAQSGVSEDINGNGTKNWHDTDADGDGIPDGEEALDDDGNGIPDYLEQPGSDSTDPSDATLVGTFSGGAFQCSAAPVTALIWPALIGLITRRRRTVGATSGS